MAWTLSLILREQLMTGSSCASLLGMISYHICHRYRLGEGED